MSSPFLGTVWEEVLFQGYIRVCSSAVVFGLLRADPEKGDYKRPTSGSAISEDTTMGVGVRTSHESPG